MKYIEPHEIPKNIIFYILISVTTVPCSINLQSSPKDYLSGNIEIGKQQLILSL